MTATDKNDIQGDFCSMLFCVLSRSDRRLSDGRLTLLFGRPIDHYYVKKNPLEDIAFSGCCDKGAGVFRRPFLRRFDADSRFARQNIGLRSFIFYAGRVE